MRDPIMADRIAIRVLDSPLGVLTVTSVDGAVTDLDWGAAVARTETGDCAMADRAAAWLAAYFDAPIPLPDDLSLAPAVSPFRQRVLKALAAIPPGRTVSYGALADRLGGSARAVGSACATNPIPILIPCHRVLAAGGRLGGFSGAGGLASKRWLLAHETRSAALPLFAGPHETEEDAP